MLSLCSNKLQSILVLKLILKLSLYKKEDVQKGQPATDHQQSHDLNANILPLVIWYNMHTICFAAPCLGRQRACGRFPRGIQLVRHLLY